jgi:hypothetical protein
MLTDLYNEGMWWAIIKKNTDKRCLSEKGVYFHKTEIVLVMPIIQYIPILGNASLPITGHLG